MDAAGERMLNASGTKTDTVRIGSRDNPPRPYGGLGGANAAQCAGSIKWPMCTQDVDGLPYSRRCATNEIDGDNLLLMGIDFMRSIGLRLDVVTNTAHQWNHKESEWRQLPLYQTAQGLPVIRFDYFAEGADHLAKKGWQNLEGLRGKDLLDSNCNLKAMTLEKIREDNYEDMCSDDEPVALVATRKAAVPEEPIPDWSFNAEFAKGLPKDWDEDTTTWNKVRKDRFVKTVKTIPQAVDPARIKDDFLKGRLDQHGRSCTLKLGEGKYQGDDWTRFLVKFVSQPKLKGRVEKAYQGTHLQCIYSTLQRAAERKRWHGRG